MTINSLLEPDEPYFICMMSSSPKAIHLDTPRETAVKSKKTTIKTIKKH